MSAAQDTVFPEPDMTGLGKAFWEALQENRLTYQRCINCNHAWLPARSECPNCLGEQWRREDSKGRGKLVSWVVYHHAYQPAFAERLPYVVAIVQLDEGPRMISNIVGDNSSNLMINQELRMVVQSEGISSIPRFEVVGKTPVHQLSNEIT